MFHVEHILTPFLELPEEIQLQIIEVLLFGSEDSLSVKDMYRILIEEPSAISAKKSGTTVDTSSQNSDLQKFEDLLPSLIEKLQRSLKETGRVFTVVSVAGGYQFATLPEYGEILARLIRSKSKRRLSQAALESLAIIAYKQPISKPEVEAIRGVNSGEVMNKLLEKNLIAIVGRSSAPGKPLLYGTTDDFLRAFGLFSITDLPKPREIEELLRSQSEENEADDLIVVDSQLIAEMNDFSEISADEEEETSEQDSPEA